jgi:uncharacterized membrane protein YfcA
LVLDPLSLALLAALGVATSALSVISGIGGGSFLIAALLMVFPPAQAIPFHGMVQLMGNLSRLALMWKHVAWRIVWRAALIVPLGAALGIFLFQGLPTRVIEVAIGTFVLLSLVASGRMKLFKERDMPLWGFFPVGFILGFAAVTVAVVAMFSGPFMMRKDMNRQGIIVTMGMLASLGHIAKVVGFGAIGFRPQDYWLPFIVMSPAVILGTFLGKQVLTRLSEDRFRLLFRLMLGTLALKLILWDGLIQPWLNHSA